ncbi:unnamed protein product [Rotaria sordida]|uniref:Uncharacterized protein n=1 Tax=Rotaria sordida TaxID=392033 RepID=A0A814KZY4_9BILA|nr:unnamed protein product [Rotaria sordida]
MPTESVTGVVAPLINEASHEKISTSDATGYNNPTTTSPSSVLPSVSSGVLKVYDVVVVSCSNDKLSNGDPIAEELITLRNELLTFGKTRSVSIGNALIIFRVVPTKLCLQQFNW